MARPQLEQDTSTYAGRCAARLRTLREKAGLTPQEVAKKVQAAGIRASDRAVYRWEIGNSTPPLKAFPILAELYGLKKVNSLLPVK